MRRQNGNGEWEHLNGLEVNGTLVQVRTSGDLNLGSSFLGC